MAAADRAPCNPGSGCASLPKWGEVPLVPGGTVERRTMSYIELPASEYRRRLAALEPSRPAERRPVRGETPTREVMVSADEVAAARRHYPQAFGAVDADATLPPSEVSARERLITEAIRIGYLPPV